MRPLLLLIAVACATPPPGQDWELVWSEEFETDGLPDVTRWSYDVGYIANQEHQYYTRARRENARENAVRVTLPAQAPRRVLLWV